MAFTIKKLLCNVEKTGLVSGTFLKFSVEVILLGCRYEWFNLLLVFQIDVLMHLETRLLHGFSLFL